MRCSRIHRERQPERREQHEADDLAQAGGAARDALQVGLDDDRADDVVAKTSAASTTRLSAVKCDHGAVCADVGRKRRRRAVAPGAVAIEARKRPAVPRHDHGGDDVLVPSEARRGCRRPRFASANVSAAVLFRRRRPRACRDRCTRRCREVEYVVGDEHAQTSASAAAVVAMLIAVSLWASVSRANQALIPRRIFAAPDHFREAEQLRAQVEFLSLDCVDVHGKPHAIVFPEQLDRAAGFGKERRFANGKDRGVP